MIFLFWQLELTKTESWETPSACVVLSVSWPNYMAESLPTSLILNPVRHPQGRSGVPSGDPPNLALGPPLRVMNAQPLPKEHVPKLGRVGSC